ncbi:hypothetical protein NST12_02145 [Bacillus sp. FSL W8-1127]|uniref:hypothetical protein n=1 Tax=unclassified Bacillus (in: firmicutes) TaxID=185979 RepID=UPI0030FA1C02
MPKVNLTENQFQLLRDYLQLLETIDEGLVWIVSHFLQGQNSNSVQKILKDVIHAFHEIHFAHLTVSEFLKEDQKALEAVVSFQILEDHMKDFLKNENVLSEQERILEYVLYPAFVRWLREIQNTFKPYIVH